MPGTTRIRSGFVASPTAIFGHVQYFHNLCNVPETNSDKNTTDHGMNMGIRSVSKEYRDVSKNNKTGGLERWLSG